MGLPLTLSACIGSYSPGAPTPKTTYDLLLDSAVGVESDGQSIGGKVGSLTYLPARSHKLAG